MFGILAKFFRFSGRENGNKFKLSIVIGLIEALASAMKIPAIMYILIGLLSGKPTGKYIGGSVAIMVLAIVVDVICKRSPSISIVLVVMEEISPILLELKYPIGRYRRCSAILILIKALALYPPSV